VQQLLNLKIYLCLIVFASLSPLQLAGAPWFSDDFSEGIQSHWSIAGEGAGAPVIGTSEGSPARHSILVAGDSGWTNYSLSAQLRTVEANDVIGLLFGYKSKGNYYRFSMDRQQGKRSLEKVVNGVAVLLAQDSFAFDENVRYAVEARMARGTIDIRVDGSSVFQVADVSHNGGKIGLYSNSALDDWSELWSRFDAVKVSAESDPPQAEPLAPGTEALAFDWNKIITDAKGRFIEGKTQWKPNNPPVRANTDWTLPPQFAQGTFQFRILIRKMKKAESFKFIYNHWQKINGKTAEMVLNHNSLSFAYSGKPITRTFSVPVGSLKSVHLDVPKFVPFNWKVPRELVGFFPPNFPGTSPQNKLEQAAMPLDIRFTVVVVGKGAKFSGWNNY
jgi:hypothetical protein